MEMTDLMQVWLPLGAVMVAPLVTWLVQKFKKVGIDPFAGLAFFSSLLAAIYVGIANFAPPEILPKIMEFLVMVGGAATLIYNVLKKFYPSMEGKK